MNDIDKMIEQYKNFVLSFSKSDSWDWWVENSKRPELLVYEVSTNMKKLKFRAFDDTPSVAIWEGLRYTDFGGDSESGDPVTRIMEVTGMNFINAVKTFLSWNDSNIVLERAQWKTVSKDKKSEVAPYKPSYIRNCIINRNKYKKDYDLLKKELFRGSSEEEIRYAESVLHIGYIPKNEEWADRIFLPEMDINGIPYGSYRYNRLEGKKPDGTKGYIRKNSKRILYGEHMLPKFKDKIIYSEGHSDTVINISKRFGCVTTGSSTKGIGINISKLKGKTLFDFPDLDFPGLKGAMLRHVEILEWNSKASEEDKIKHTIFWWADWIYSEKIFDKLMENKVEKTDMFYFIKDKIPVKNNRAFFNIDILRVIQKEICRKKSWDFDSLDMKNWKVIFKNQSKPEGYDFADFYLDNNSSEKRKLLSFLNSSVKY